MPTGKFYVYLIRDPRPEYFNVERYVGKGQKGRAQDHFTSSRSHNLFLGRFIMKCRRLCLNPSIEIIEYFHDEADAYEFEKLLIKRYGRRDLNTGSLYNLTDGGEGASNCKANGERLRRLHADPVFSKANRERLSQAHSNPIFEQARLNGLRKCHADPEFTQKRLTAQRNRYADPEFAKIHAERARNLAHKLHADPKSKKAYSDRMLKLRANPEFISRIKDGIADYWAKKRGPQ